jgi:hypothetical protein
LIPINDKYIRFGYFTCILCIDERCLIERPVSIDALNDLVENVSVSFIESILMICGYWFLATQIDTFIRNGTALDPCVINTYSLSYPTSLVLKVLPKSSYKRITWNEIAILYGRFELLVTGGVYVELDDPIIKAFNVEDLDSKKLEMLLPTAIQQASYLMVKTL